MSKRHVDKAIQQFEKGEVEPSDKLKNSTGVDLLKMEMINLLIKENYQKKY